MVEGKRPSGDDTMVFRLGVSEILGTIDDDCQRLPWTNCEIQRRRQIRGVDVNKSSDSVEHVIFQLVSPKSYREVWFKRSPLISTDPYWGFLLVH